MSKICKRNRNKNETEHQKYISRITKTFYYGKFPKPDGLSLPVTELAAELFSEAQVGRSLDRLHYDNAAHISRNACVSPCSLVIAILYLERLKKKCPKYIERTSSSDLFLISLMVSCKFLYDDGEADEVFIDEWAFSGGLTVEQLVQLEKDFLRAIEWEVFVNELTFWKKLNEIEGALARKQGIFRGFFTYTELRTLLNTMELKKLIQNIVSISVVLIASYTVALLTLFGSVVIVSHVPGAYLQSQRYNLEQRNTVIADNGAKFNNEQKQVKLNNDVTTLHAIKKTMHLTLQEDLFEPICNKSNTVNPSVKDNVQNISWEWWTVPALRWLTETSSLFEQVEMPKLDLYFHHFVKQYKQFFNLDSEVNHFTKFRILDQLENTWTEKWVDTIRYEFSDKYLPYYSKNVKS